MSLKILLADDSVTAQNMGKKILSDAGYEVVAVSNGSAALKKVPEIKPDLVILDIYMPGYSGLEVCQKIKEARQTASVPVLLTVGKLEPFKARDASRVRADGFIVKPFEATELLATIKRIVGTVPDAPPVKNKSGEELKSRVKQARLASQAAEAEQMASALRDALPPDAAEQGLDPDATIEIVRKDRDEYRSPVRGREDGSPAPAAEFRVSKSQDAGEEDQDYGASERVSGAAKFTVDFEKPPKRVQREDDKIPFRASSFDSWEKARNVPEEPAGERREDALQRIRAAREAEASEQGDREEPQAEPQQEQPAAWDAAHAVSEQAPGEAVRAEAVTSANSEPAAQSEPQYQEQTEEPRSAVEQPAAASSEVPVSSAEPVPSKEERPISGLADWAADLREETFAGSQSSSVEVTSKWIAEEVPLGSGDSGGSLTEEMRKFHAGPAEPAPVEAVDAGAVVQEESQPVETSEGYAVATPVEAVGEPESAPEAAQPENGEEVAALAKAAAAAAMSSISEIREAVLASAAAAGVSGSTVVESRTVEQPAEAAPSVDMSQFAAQPSAAPVEDVQGATIAAVTKEVTESAPADLNSDAIASIVNRVIEQMKPKLVAEIAKELTHKPKDE